MPWKRIGAIAAIVLVGGAFLAGYLPEHGLRTAAEQQSVALREQLAAAEARVRMGQLLGQALTLREVVMRQNYGQAQALSSSFFNGVSGEVAATPLNEFREPLTEVLSRRDSVTAALTKGDPAAVELLHAIEVRIRSALGYPLPPESAARAATTTRHSATSPRPRTLTRRWLRSLNPVHPGLWVSGDPCIFAPVGRVPHGGTAVRAHARAQNVGRPHRGRFEIMACRPTAVRRGRCEKSPQPGDALRPLARSLLSAHDDSADVVPTEAAGVDCLPTFGNLGVAS